MRIKSVLTIHSTASLGSLLVILVTTFFGATFFSPLDVIKDDLLFTTWVHLRIPRTLFSFFVGGGLALCGAIYQAMFRNSLASPFSLGVSAAASLGAALAITIGATTHFPEITQVVAAISGAGCAIIFILKIGATQRADHSGFILLAGVAVSLFSGSLITLIQYLSDYSQLFRVTRWMIGGVMTVSYLELLLVVFLALLLLVQFSKRWRDLDLLLFGAEMATAKGVDIREFNQKALITTSIFVGVVVALCGVIGFIGIIVPASVRLITGVGHRQLIPLSFYLGGTLVVLCDCLGRTLAPPFEIPVGVFTALIGAPVFLWLLTRARNGALV
jgi:iron complex transport system permease protein